MVSISEPTTTHRYEHRSDLPFGSPEEEHVPGLPPVWTGAIPPGIDDMPPGPELAAWLSVVDPTTLSGHDRVSLLRAHQRLVSHFQAQMYRDMTAVKAVLQSGDNVDDHVHASFAAEAEIRAALAWSRRRTENELSFAIDLESRHPTLMRALESGGIDVARAKAIDSGTAHLPRRVAESVCHTVLPEASDLTVGQVQARVRTLAVAAEPEEAESRYEEAHERRRVVLEPTQDGTGNVLAMDLSPAAATAVTHRIAGLARRAAAADDPRTPDQVRADVFVDLILGNRSRRTTVGETPYAARRSADVEIRVDLTTLMGLNERPADIPGFGPVISEIARKTADEPTSQWRFTATDPHTGRPVSTGKLNRRPSAAQGRQVRAQQPTCVFPGCRAPATDCDLDHTKPWQAGGATETNNLAPLCRHDHRIKGEAGWSYAQKPNGDVVWHSPLGHRYVRTRPPP